MNAMCRELGIRNVLLRDGQELKRPALTASVAARTYRSLNIALPKLCAIARSSGMMIDRVDNIFEAVWY